MACQSRHVDPFVGCIFPRNCVRKALGEAVQSILKGNSWIPAELEPGDHLAESMGATHILKNKHPEVRVLREGSIFKSLREAMDRQPGVSPPPTEEIQGSGDGCGAVRGRE